MNGTALKPQQVEDQGPLGPGCEPSLRPGERRNITYMVLLGPTVSPFSSHGAIRVGADPESLPFYVMR